MTTVDFDHEWMTWGRSGGVLSSQGQSAQLDIGVMSFQRRAEVVAEIEGEVARGISLKQATDQANQSPGVAHRSQVHSLSEGKYVVDDTAAVGADSAVDTLKSVTSVAAGGKRIIAITGALSFDGESDYDSLEAFGALVVRLNIDLWFAVGPAARSLFLSVGREGSWAGESQHCLDIDTAYDEVRALIRPDDVVIVMGSTGESLRPLVSRLLEDFS